MNFSIFFRFLLILVLAFSDAGRAEESRPAVITSDDLPAEIPMRVISMAPSITEILFAVRAEDQVIAVTDFCAFPPAATEKEKVGGYLQPSFEKIIGLQPEIIFFQGQHEKLREFCDEFGIPWVSFRMESVADVEAAIKSAGNILEHDEAAAQWSAAFQKDLTALKESRTRETEQPTVLLSVTRTPGNLANIFSAGSNSFMHELLELAGGKNLLGDISAPYPQVSLEAVVERGPDVILELRYDPNEKSSVTDDLLQDWAEIEILPAVKSGKIAVISGEALLTPGPRMLLTAGQLRAALYPESAPLELQTQKLVDGMQVD